MKKTISKSQLERLITESVQETLSETRRKPNRRVMNEAQLKRYINDVINEELENEGLWNQIKSGVKGARAGFERGNGIINSFKQGYNNAKGAWNAQGEVDKYDDFSSMVQKMLDAGLKPEITLGQIAAGKAGKNTKFNSFNSKRAQSSRKLNKNTTNN